MRLKLSIGWRFLKKGCADRSVEPSLTVLTYELRANGYGALRATQS